jgi:hypothetical protein
MSIDQQQGKKRDIEKNFDKIRVRVMEIRSKQDNVAIEKAETAIEYAVRPSFHLMLNRSLTTP